MDFAFFVGRKKKKMGTTGGNNKECKYKASLVKKKVLLRAKKTS